MCQLQTHAPLILLATAPVPPPAHGLAMVQSVQYTIKPFAGVPNVALVLLGK